MVKHKSLAKKGVKKSFFEVSAPLTSTKVLLYASDISELDGKTVKIDLTKSLKGKSLELKLRIRKEGNSLVSEPERIHLVSSYVRKVMRRGSDYVEDSFVVSCRDNSVRVKPFLITRRRVSRSVLKSLRVSAKGFIESYVKTRNAKELFSEIIANKLQKQLASHLKKIYPLALCEIRVFEIARVKTTAM